MTPSTTFHQANDAWTFTDLAGRVHAARPMGHARALHWLSVFQWAGNDAWKVERTVSRFTADLFPARPRYWFTVQRRRWKLALPVLLLGLGWGVLHHPIVAAAFATLGVLGMIGPGEVWPWLEFQKLPGPRQMEAIHDFFRRAGEPMNPPTPATKPCATSSRSTSDRVRQTASAR